jgi:hypothetical protein
LAASTRTCSSRCSSAQDGGLRTIAAGAAGPPRDRRGGHAERPLPAWHDATILAHVVHGFRERQNQQLLERVYAAAPAGGRLLIVDFFLDESRTDPVMATLMSGEFLVNTGALL